MNCTCRAYPFPHKEKTGRCLAGDYQYCGDCGQPCDIKQVDDGIGAYEFWGRTGVDRRISTVSRCCEANVFSNASLTEPLGD